MKLALNKTNLKRLEQYYQQQAQEQLLAFNQLQEEKENKSLTSTNDEDSSQTSKSQQVKQDLAKQKKIKKMQVNNNLPKNSQLNTHNNILQAFMQQNQFLHQLLLNAQISSMIRNYYQQQQMDQTRRNNYEQTNILSECLPNNQLCSQPSLTQVPSQQSLDLESPKLLQSNTQLLFPKTQSQPSLVSLSSIHSQQLLAQPQEQQQLFLQSRNTQIQQQVMELEQSTKFHQQQQSIQCQTPVQSQLPLLQDQNHVQTQIKLQQEVQCPNQEGKDNCNQQIIPKQVQQQQQQLQQQQQQISQEQAQQQQQQEQSQSQPQPQQQQQQQQQQQISATESTQPQAIQSTENHQEQQQQQIQQQQGLSEEEIKRRKEERQMKIQRYLQKKHNRKWDVLRYEVRKKIAKTRMRVKGRFVKEEATSQKATEQTQVHDSLNIESEAQKQALIIVNSSSTKDNVISQKNPSETIQDENINTTNIVAQQQQYQQQQQITLKSQNVDIFKNKLQPENDQSNTVLKEQLNIC